MGLLYALRCQQRTISRLSGVEQPAISSARHSHSLLLFAERRWAGVDLSALIDSSTGRRIGADHSAIKHRRHWLDSTFNLPCADRAELRYALLPIGMRIFASSTGCIRMSHHLCGQVAMRMGRRCSSELAGERRRGPRMVRIKFTPLMPDTNSRRVIEGSWGKQSFASLVCANLPTSDSIIV
jgi:hypothetical protein